MNTLELIQNFEADKLFTKIWCEKAEIIARILVCMEIREAPKVFEKLTLKAQVDVIENIAKMEEIKPSELNQIDKLLTGQDSDSLYESGLAKGGIDEVVELLNLTDNDIFKKLTGILEESNPELSDEIIKRMSVFEDIVMLGESSIKYILTKLDDNDLAIALKGVDSEIANFLFRNMPKEKMKKIKKDMDYIGPVRKVDAEDAQWKIIKLIRKLKKGGEIN